MRIHVLASSLLTLAVPLVGCDKGNDQAKDAPKTAANEPEQDTPASPEPSTPAGEDDKPATEDPPTEEPGTDPASTENPTDTEVTLSDLSLTVIDHPETRWGARKQVKVSGTGLVSSSLYSKRLKTKLVCAVGDRVYASTKTARAYDKPDSTKPLRHEGLDEGESYHFAATAFDRAGLPGEPTRCEIETVTAASHNSSAVSRWCWDGASIRAGACQGLAIAPSGDAGLSVADVRAELYTVDTPPLTATGESKGVHAYFTMTAKESPNERGLVGAQVACKVGERVWVLATSEDLSLDRPFSFDPGESMDLGIETDGTGLGGDPEWCEFDFYYRTDSNGTRDMGVSCWRPGSAAENGPCAGPAEATTRAPYDASAVRWDAIRWQWVKHDDHKNKAVLHTEVEATMLSAVDHDAYFFWEVGCDGPGRKSYHHSTPIRLARVAAGESFRASAAAFEDGVMPLGADSCELRVRGADPHDTMASFCIRGSKLSAGGCDEKSPKGGAARTDKVYTGTP